MPVGGVTAGRGLDMLEVGPRRACGPSVALVSSCREVRPGRFGGRGLGARRRRAAAAGVRIRAVAGQAGLVLRNVGLIEDLRSSRQRLAAVVDEARRGLERGLHDGASSSSSHSGLPWAWPGRW
jgi:hypothetical protein